MSPPPCLRTAGTGGTPCSGACPLCRCVQLAGRPRSSRGRSGPTVRTLIAGGYGGLSRNCSIRVIGIQTRLGEFDLALHDCDQWDGVRPWRSRSWPSVAPACWVNCLSIVPPGRETGQPGQRRKCRSFPARRQDPPIGRSGTGSLDSAAPPLPGHSLRGALLSGAPSGGRRRQKASSAGSIARLFLGFELPIPCDRLTQKIDHADTLVSLRRRGRFSCPAGSAAPRRSAWRPPWPRRTEPKPRPAGAAAGCVGGGGFSAAAHAPRVAPAPRQTISASTMAAPARRAGAAIVLAAVGWLSGRIAGSERPAPPHGAQAVR